MILKKGLWVVVGVSAGIGLESILDPAQGKRRRAKIQDKMHHFNRAIRKNARVTAVDLRNRTRGLIATTRTNLSRQGVPDDLLVAHVAAQLGRLVSNPHPIELTAEDGVVYLGGPIYQDEVERLVSMVESMHGVKGVNQNFQAVDRNDLNPSLQGRVMHTGKKIDILQKQWSPATRFLVGLGSSLMGVTGGLLITGNKKGSGVGKETAA